VRPTSRRGCLNGYPDTNMYEAVHGAWGWGAQQWRRHLGLPRSNCLRALRAVQSAR
jgi:hypothetical protein